MSGLSATLLIFSFQFSLLFFNIGRQAAPPLRHTIGFNEQCRTSDVTGNLCRYLSCAERTQFRGKDFELILTVKMETRHPLKGQFGSEFPAICNHCSYDCLKSQDLEILWTIFVFFGKTILYGEIFKILFVFGKFSSPHQSTLLCWNFVKFIRREIGEIVRYLPDKKFSCLSDCRYSADSAHNLPGPAPNNLLRVLQI